MVNENVIIYEQPLNELIRVCLRLEQLFEKADHELTDHSITGTRNLILTLLHLLQLVERPDLKAKLAKELGHQMQQLSRLERSPGIDEQKLDFILKQLDELNRHFIESSKKIAHELREVEMLNSLRVHLSTPGGGCSFDTPLFYYWLQQPDQTRVTTMQQWLAQFKMIRLASNLILKLVREATRGQQKMATNGFHQELLDAQTNLKLIRVAVPQNNPSFPEISLSRHFLSIRFLMPAIESRPTQYPENFPFWLSYCSG